MAKLNILNEEMIFPKRATLHSAGHDVYATNNITIAPSEIQKIEVPFTIDFDETKERVFLFLRSSIGIKKNCRFSDEYGVIKSFYQLKDGTQPVIYLKNIGDEAVVIEKDTHYCQLVITSATNNNREFLLEKVSTVPKGIQLHPMSFRKGEKNVYTLHTEVNIKLKPKESIMLASGYKAKIDTDSFLAGFVPVEEERFIYSNGVAIGDADYYNNENNEGLYFFKIENHTEEEVEIEKGSPIVDLMSIGFLTLENEKEAPTALRKGGIGSTTKTSPEI